MVWDGYVACMREMINAYIILFSKLKGKRRLEIPKRRWDDIKIDIKEVG
jgi:hypothetical protein